VFGRASLFWRALHNFFVSLIRIWRYIDLRLLFREEAIKKEEGGKKEREEGKEGEEREEKEEKKEESSFLIKVTSRKFKLLPPICMVKFNRR